MASFGTDRLGVDLLWGDDTTPPPGHDDLLLPGTSLPGGGGHHTSHDLDFLSGLGAFEVGHHTRLPGGGDGGHGDTTTGTSDMLSYLSASHTVAPDFLWDGAARGGSGTSGWRCLENCHQPCLKCVPLHSAGGWCCPACCCWRKTRTGNSWGGRV
jgi:hypothetical protein